jgi:hypothetical protein
LQLTRQFGIREASAFLLERNGAIDQAVRELFDVVEESIRVFMRPLGGGVNMPARTRSTTYHVIEINDLA